ncbi:MAG: hypothetical protein PHD95_00520 [Candidatus ainarchaeum sp.]|nr:hypothetical protein [Candidatus ainarchaeum sp.]
MGKEKKHSSTVENLSKEAEKPVHGQQEQAQKKERPHTEKKPLRFGKALENKYFPALLSIALIVVIAAGTLLIFSMNAPQQLSIGDFQHADITQKHIAKILLLYSKDCAGCENYNSFLNLLQENDIVYQLEKIEISSEDGNKIVSLIKPRRVPFVLLDARSIDSTMQIRAVNGSETLKNVLDNVFVRIEKVAKLNDSYFIPEIAFEEFLPVKNKVYPIEMMLDANSCGSGSKVQVDLYTDPYCAPCALSTASLEENKSIFGSEIDFNYNFFPVDSKKMLYKWEKISPFANYSICTNRQAALKEFQIPVYKYYCAPDKNFLDMNSLQNCAESTNFHIPIPADILSEAIAFARIDKTQFGTCLEQVEKDKPLMISTANSYGINEVPHVVMNCKFITHADNLKNGICAANPALPQCNFSVTQPQ